MQMIKTPAWCLCLKGGDSIKPKHTSMHSQQTVGFGVISTFEVQMLKIWSYCFRGLFLYVFIRK